MSDNKRVHNLNVASQEVLITPDRLKEKIPLALSFRNLVVCAIYFL